MRKADEIIRRLEKVYGEQLAYSGTEDTPFKVLIGTILSHRTKDERTALAAKQLFSKYDTAQKLAKAKANKVQKLIKPVGFYRVKAKRIITIAGDLLKRFNGKVPDKMDELLSITGVGRKTAGCVLVYAFRKPAIPVDSHVHIISNRLKLVNTTNPEQTELALMKAFRKKDWISVNNLFVLFGQTICKSTGPRCKTCPLNELCQSRKVKANTPLEERLKSL